MSNRANETSKKTLGDKPSSDAQDPNLIWDEYKYRHEHCWKLIFQITIAVVVIYIVPYIRDDVAGKLQYWIIVVPLIGIALTLFGLVRLRRELDLLDPIRNKHRELHRSLYDMDSGGGKESFKLHATIYMAALVALGIVNIFVIWRVWLPGLS
jgi:hypothetical protein